MKRKEEDKYKHPPTEEELNEQRRVEDLVHKHIATAKLHNFRELHISGEEDYMNRKVSDASAPTV
jgi:hypothetical protein